MSLLCQTLPGVDTPTQTKPHIIWWLPKLAKIAMVSQAVFKGEMGSWEICMHYADVREE